MMNSGALIFGLFILAAILKNKDLSGKEAAPENKDIFTYLSVLGLILVLFGLNFIIDTQLVISASGVILFMMFGFFAIATVSDGSIRYLAGAACLLSLWMLAFWHI